MRAHGLVALTTACAVGLGCHASQRGDDSATAVANTETAVAAPSACATRPLTPADVAQYASVMHAAAARWHDLPAGDRSALAAARSIEAHGSTPDPSAIATMADKLQRASELKTGMDRIIARERHLPLDCYDAIASRIETVAPDQTTLASGDPGDAAGAVPTPAERARQTAARQQETADSAVVAPRRAELQPLIHEVRMAHIAD